MKNTKSTTAKSNRTSNKAKVPYNYRQIKIGAIRYPSASKAAIAMLKRTKLSQSEIARRCGVSQPCVAQLKAAMEQ
jgi:DNA-directed RNA polymerase specialized sigma subunit